MVTSKTERLELADVVLELLTRRDHPTIPRDEMAERMIAWRRYRG